MLIKGYIDESYNKRMFTLSAILASGHNWAWFESDWKKRIVAKNKELKKRGRPQISRFHASDCSNLKGEFKEWTMDEQVRFMQDLIGVFRKYKYMIIAAYSLPLDVFITVFPECEKKVLPCCYSTLLKFLMAEIAAGYEKAKSRGDVRPVYIALIHDRTRYDTVLLRAFNQMVNNQGFEGREYFSAITPLAWEECIPLQAADLLAYEHMKDADRIDSGSPRQQRKSLTALLNLPSLGGRTLRFDEPSLRQWRLSLESRNQNNP